VGNALGSVWEVAAENQRQGTRRIRTRCLTAILTAQGSPRDHEHAPRLSRRHVDLRVFARGVGFSFQTPKRSRGPRRDPSWIATIAAVALQVRAGEKGQCTARPGLDRFSETLYLPHGMWGGCAAVGLVLAWGGVLAARARRSRRAVPRGRGHGRDPATSRPPTRARGRFRRLGHRDAARARGGAPSLPALERLRGVVLPRGGGLDGGLTAVLDHLAVLAPDGLVVAAWAAPDPAGDRALYVAAQRGPRSDLDGTGGGGPRRGAFRAGGCRGWRTAVAWADGASQAVYARVRRDAATWLPPVEVQPQSTVSHGSAEPRHRTGPRGHRPRGLRRVQEGRRDLPPLHVPFHERGQDLRTVAGAQHERVERWTWRWTTMEPLWSLSWPGASVAWGSCAPRTPEPPSPSPPRSPLRGANLTVFRA
jgi:hypothetical protein